MDNITFEAMPQTISELIQKVDTLQSTVAALQKHCSKQQVEQMIGIDETAIGCYFKRSSFWEQALDEAVVYTIEFYTWNSSIIQ